MTPPVIDAISGWPPLAGAQVIRTLDMHTGGEPLRVIVGGLPNIPGRTVLEKRAYFRDHHDDLRTSLMWEPRGHADMYGAILSASDVEAGAFDVFFLHNEGYSTMCGHAILALTKLVVESGAVPEGQSSVTFHVPAGRIAASAVIHEGRVVESRFRNVPSFVLHQDAEVDVPGMGRLKLDVAYGGAFYAIVDAAGTGLSLTPTNVTALMEAGRRIKAAVTRQLSVIHPFEPELSFLYGVIFTAPTETPHVHSRNVCVFADGEIDRSATGSGVSSRAALEVARTALAIGDVIVIESITGSTMCVSAVERLMYGPHAAVVPEVRGRAHYTGRHEFWIDPADPMHRGFLLR